MITLVTIDIVLLCILLLLGVPVTLSFGAALLFLVASGFVSMNSLMLVGFSSVLNPVLLAIPLFIFAGSIMGDSGIAERLINFVNTLVGRIRGGIGVVATVTCAVIGAISGSAFTGVVAIGPILIPRMAREGYPRGYATALITCSTVLGLLIPPSNSMILYGWVTETSILACFLAIVGPGLLLVTAYSIINLFTARGMPDLVLEPSMNLRERGREFLNRGGRAAAGLIMPIIILGGIYGGVFTPTEAAAVAVFYSIPVGLVIYRGLNAKNFYRAVADAAIGAGTIMVLILVVFMYTQSLILLRVPVAIYDFMLGITTNKYLLLFLVNLFLFFIGMIMTDAAGIAVAAPLLLPLVTKIGVSPVHFAAILGTNLAMGGITPPCAAVLYLGMRVGKVEFIDILKPAMKFLLFGGIPVIFITTYWPDLPLFLPRLLGYAS